MRIRKLWSIVVTLLMAIIVLSVPDRAYAVSPGWTQCGTCEWRVLDGTFIIRPENNGSEGTLDNWGAIERPPWYEATSVDVRDSVTSVRIDGVVHAPNAAYLFYGFNNVEEIDATNIDVSSAESMHGAFSSLSNLKSVDISTWDFSNVTDCYDMFHYMPKLETIVFPEYVDLRNCVDMGYMFNYCPSLRNVDMSAIHTSSKLERVNCFFRSSGVADGVYDFSNMNTSGVTAMGEFASGAKFSELNLSNWTFNSDSHASFLYNAGNEDSTLIADNIVAVGDRGREIFGSCTAGIISATNVDLSRATNIDYMFRGCKTTDITFISDTAAPNLTRAEYMFYECPNLKTVDMYFDSSSLVEMNGMFDSCTSLENIDLSWMDMTSARDLGSFFYKCTSLKNVDLHGWNLDHSNVSLGTFFQNASVENLDISGWKLNNPYIGSFSAGTVCKHIDAHDMVLKGTVTGLFSTYTGVGGGAVETIDLTNVNTSGVTNFYYLFGECAKLKKLDLSSFDTSSATSLESMFHGCSSLESLDLSSFDTSNVTHMDSTFEGCSSLESLDISSFDTSNVTTMARMFEGCSSLKEIDVSNFNVESVTIMNFMFKDCSSLERILSRGDADWKVQSGVTYSDRDMFAGCTMLSGGVGTEWDEGNIGISYARVDGLEDRPGYFKADAIRFIYDANGGLGVTPEQYVYKDKPVALRPNMFSLFDHTFTGWNTNADGTGDAYEDREVINNTERGQRTVTLYAQWVRANHDVDVVDGTIEVDVPAGHKLTMDDLPAGMAYQIFEQTDSGWVLVEQTNSSGSVAAESETAALFTNKYNERSTSAQIYGTKTLDGFAPEAGAFGFVLRDADGHDVEYVLNSAGGAVVFSPLVFTKAGTYEYTVREVKGMDVVGTDGECYASFDEDGVFTIFRDEPGKYEPYEQTVIDGKKAVIFTDFEDITSAANPTPWPWYMNQSSYSTYLRGTSFTAPNNVSKVVVRDPFKPKCTAWMFYQFGASSADGIVEADFSKMQTSEVTDMAYMFYGSGFVNLDLRTFDTSNVTNMSSTFCSATKLENLCLVGWDTSKVTNMYNMFAGIGSNVKVLDLSTFDFSSATGSPQTIFGGGAFDIIKFGQGMNKPVNVYISGIFERVEDGTVVQGGGTFATGAGTWVRQGVDGSWYETPESLAKPIWSDQSFSVGLDEDITYDEHVERVIVTVEDDGDFMTASVAYDTDGVAFRNKTNPGSLTLKKIVEGQTNANKDDEFTFLIQLRNENGQPLDEIHMNKTSAS